MPLELPGKREQIVVENVIRMAGELGITVICEGCGKIRYSPRYFAGK